MTDQEQLAKLRWQCRRGMLELDTKLIKFLEQEYSTLPTALQKQFTQLLNESDPDIFAWLLGSKAPKPEFNDIVKLIREHATSNN